MDLEAAGRPFPLRLRESTLCNKALQCKLDVGHEALVEAGVVGSDVLDDGLTTGVGPLLEGYVADGGDDHFVVGRVGRWFPGRRLGLVGFVALGDGHLELEFLLEFFSFFFFDLIGESLDETNAGRRLRRQIYT